MAEIMSRADVETETRVSVLETQIDTISGSVTKLEQKIETNYATLHGRISDLRDDLRNDIDAKHEKIIDKLDSQTKISSEQHAAITSKINAIEKWRYMLVGGAIVMGYVLAHIKLDKLF